MKRSFIKYTFLVSTLAFIFFLFGGISFAAPYTGEVYRLKQPDNTYVDVKVWGDEFYQRVESMDGYTLCYDSKTNWIYYADVNKSETELESTGIIYRGAAKSEVLLSNNKVLSKGLKIKRESILKKASDKYKTLFLGPDPDYLANLASDQTQYEASYMANGNVKGLTILIDFPDCKSSISKDEISNMLNQHGYRGYNNNGSVMDYFYDVSGGKLTYTNEVVGFYTAKNSKTYYNDPNANGRVQELVLETLNYMKTNGYDFSVLSTNQSNMILAVSILYAGEPDVLWGKGLWPQTGSISGFGANGVSVGKFQISPIRSSLQIGTFVHESCHMVCGYPDLYDYQNDSKGVGSYCVMGATGTTNPQPPNAYLRCVVSGWGTVTNLNQYPNGSWITLKSNSQDVYQYTNPYLPNEFFVIESVKKQGRWSSMPDEGMVIWHVDQRGKNDWQSMTPTSHYEVSLEQADGLFQLEYNMNNGGANDLFHYSYASVFNDFTIPSSKWWNGSISGLDISGISEVGDYMSFTIHNKNAPPTSTPTSTLTPTSTPTPIPTPTAKVYKLAGYVAPDFEYLGENIKAGFKIEIAGTDKYAISDSNGYFEIPDLKENWFGYTMIISKTGFLTKILGGIFVFGDMYVGLQTSPLYMWVGDLNQDGAINMTDIIAIAGSYNSILGDGRYNEYVDINKDNVVNIADIMLAVRHFNKTSWDYLVLFNNTDL